jgi:hypothetical protein
MSPWRSDGGIIECEGTELGLVDLHNECDFLQLRVMPAAQLQVLLMFRHLPTGKDFGLSFADVSGFSAEQLDYHSSDALLFHDAGHVPDGSGSSAVEMELAAVRLEFRACEVRFVLPESWGRERCE